MKGDANGFLVNQRTFFSLLDYDKVFMSKKNMMIYKIKEMGEM